MKLRDFIPPAAAQIARSIMKSFSTTLFLRGEDFDARTTNKLTEPYNQSAWVRAALNAITGPISGRELKFYDGENEYNDPRFSAWWSAPARGPKTAGQQKRLSRADVVRDLAYWAKAKGEFFILLDDEWILATASRRAALLNPFIVANPDRMQIILQGDTLAGWRYSAPGGRQVELVPEQVIHWKNLNPNDDWRGSGGLDAARLAADAAFSTSAYIRDLMRNNGDQGFIVTSKGGPLEDGQREQVVADLKAKRAALRNGRALDIFIEGGDVGVERPTERAAGADLVATVQLSAQEIFIAFDVPPSMATVKQAYSIGKDSDRYQLIIDTCMPLGVSIASALAEVGSKMAGRVLTAELDWDDHPTMVEVRNSRIDTLGKLCDRGMPVSLASDYLDLGLPKYAGSDQGYMPFSVSPTGDPTPAPTVDPTLAENTDQQKTADLPEIAQIKALLALRSRASAPTCEKVSTNSEDFSIFCCGCHGDELVTSDASDRARRLWQSHMRQRKPTMKAFESAFGRVLMTARQETLRKIAGAAGAALPKKRGQSVETRAAASDFTFDLAKFADAFTAAMRNQQKSALQTAGEQFFKEIGKDDPFKTPAEAVLDFVAGRQNKLRDVPQDIFNQIKDAITAGLNDGDTQDELAARVRGAFNGVSDERAKRIAASETAAAYGAGRDQAMRQAGIQFKAWLTSGNANVRPAHLLAGADYPPERAIPIDQPFVVDGEELMYPGDESGSPGNVINCHCISLSVAAPGGAS